MKDFKSFIMRGNVVDLAVAVAIGAAFGAIVTSLVKDFITPLIGAIYQSKTFSQTHFTVHGSQFMYGDFANSVLSFLIIAAVIFFLIVLPINKLKARAASSKTTEEPTDKKCPECLSTIPKAAKRCAFCTSKV